MPTSWSTTARSYKLGIFARCIFARAKCSDNRDISFATVNIVATRAFQNGRGIVSSARALVETPGKLDETAAPMHQARWSKHQGQASNRTPVQEIREAMEDEPEIEHGSLMDFIFNLWCLELGRL